MSLFAKAAVVTDKPKAKKAKEKTQIEVKDIELFAALKAAKDAVEAQLSVVEAGIKNVIFARGVDEGIRTGKKMDSFEGIEKGSSASLQLRCRSSASGLSEEEVEILAEHNIPLDENVQVEECFRINPAYSDLTDPANAELLDKVSQALETLGLPADFIQKQEKVFKTIATEDSIAAVCKIQHKAGKNKGKADEATIAALLPLVTVAAIRPKLAEGVNPFEIVDAALNPKEEEEAEGETAVAA